MIACQFKSDNIIKIIIILTNKIIAFENVHILVIQRQQGKLFASEALNI